jgi:hypothetical protein
MGFPPQLEGSAVRTFVSAIATLLGVLLAAVAVPAIWVDRSIVREDGFVALAAPLGRNTDFQQQLARATVGTIDTSAVPGFLHELVQPVLENAAGTLTGLPGYPAAWEETLHRSHRLSFPRAAGDMGPGPESTPSLTLDVAPLVALGVDEISSATGLPLSPPAQTLITVGRPEQREWTAQLAAYAPLGYLLAAGSGVAFLLALVVARRRWSVLTGAGLGGLLAAGLWALAAQVGTGQARAAETGNEVANLFKDEFVAAANTGFMTWTAGAAIISGALLVLGTVTGIAAKRAVPTR